MTRRRVDENRAGRCSEAFLGGQQAPRPCLLACIPTEGPSPAHLVTSHGDCAWGTPHGVLGPSDNAGKRYTVPHDHPARPVVREPRGWLPHWGRGEASLGVNEAPEMFCRLSVGSGSRCQSA